VRHHFELPHLLEPLERFSQLRAHIDPTDLVISGRRDLSHDHRPTHFQKPAVKIYVVPAQANQLTHANLVKW
jgi:hypothetical protein